jgi:3-dehydroquinate dehydratase I
LGRHRFSSTATKETILNYAKKSPLVCTTILAKSKKEFLKTAISAARLCDIAELRVDYLKEPNTQLIDEIISESPLPLIVTNRSYRDGGLFSKSEESLRVSLIEASLDCSPAFVDIELGLPDEERSKLIRQARRNNVGVICSYHDFVSTPSVTRIVSLGKQISETGADITKLAFMSSDSKDASRILEAANMMSKEENLFALFGMGESGRITRLAGLLFGSCLVYCSLGRADKKLGQIGVGYTKEYVGSLKSYGWPRIKEDRARFFWVLQRELRSGKHVDHRFDPIAALEIFLDL